MKTEELFVSKGYHAVTKMLLVTKLFGNDFLVLPSLNVLRFRGTRWEGFAEIARSSDNILPDSSVREAQLNTHHMDELLDEPSQTCCPGTGYPSQESSKPILTVWSLRCGDYSCWIIILMTLMNFLLAQISLTEQNGF